MTHGQNEDIDNRIILYARAFNVIVRLLQYVVSTRGNLVHPTAKLAGGKRKLVVVGP